MVFVENPTLGRKLSAGEECAVVESVKAASDVYAPMAGEVTAATPSVEGSPELINKDPYARLDVQAQTSESGGPERAA